MSEPLRRRASRVAGTVAGVVGRRFRSLFGIGRGSRQSLIALALNSSTSLVAGAVLGSITGTLDRFPGLLVLVPAAIGLRGNIFSTFGNRLSTAMHVGEFDPSLRRGTVLRQNVDASLVLTLLMSTIIAALAWSVGAAVGIADLASPLELATISIVGGLIGSAVVLLASLALTAGAVRYGWDLDNVVAPVVSTLGDVLTLPALWLATFVTDIPWVGAATGVVLTVVSVVLFVVAVRGHQRVLRRVCQESWPVLTVAAALSTLAGIVLERRLATFAAFPALLMLQPAFVSSAGALGGILSSRTGSKLHLGLVAPRMLPERDVQGDALVTLGLFVPVYVFNGIGAHVVARLLGQPSPGAVTMTGVALVGGLLAVAFALAVAYYGTIGAVALRVDPDTYGIPVVTSAVDFVGVIALVAAASLFGATV